MTRLTAKDFAPELLELYDFYVHGKINRREFLDRAAVFTLGATALSVLGALSPNYALAEQVAVTDPDIKGEYIEYPSPNGHGQVRGYLVRPAQARRSKRMNGCCCSNCRKSCPANEPGAIIQKPSS